MAQVKTAQYQSRLCCLNVPWCYYGSNNRLANRLSSMGLCGFSINRPTYLCRFLCESTQPTTVGGATLLFESVLESAVDRKQLFIYKKL